MVGLTSLLRHSVGVLGKTLWFRNEVGRDSAAKQQQQQQNKKEVGGNAWPKHLGAPKRSVGVEGTVCEEG